eukprot:TRINITY_DN46157_c0_g1_i1.p1 TRINITY_DN46157_c0_g1~~TRINITY_DN46157_c0_g1_i1.p1  ORF type:complete len:273 (-),score=23.97 TRINITY_DN46157_c0_g1_i1:268-1086(-)
MERSLPTSTLKVVARGCKGFITFSRANKLNALSPQLLKDLIAASNWFNSVCQDCKVVVISGEGKSFTAGADIRSSFNGETTPELGRLASEAVENMKAITIAQIHGHCIGGGVVLASACDLRFGAAKTTFSIPELDLGIPLGWGGLHRLVRDIGVIKTKELVMTCRSFTAEEALAMGFLNAVLPDTATLSSTVSQVATRLCEQSKLALQMTKGAVNRIGSHMVDLKSSQDDKYLLECAQHDEESNQVRKEYINNFITRSQQNKKREAASKPRL